MVGGGGGLEPNFHPVSPLVSTVSQLLKPTVIYMSRVARKPVFRICENKDADQLRGNREADQRLCFRYIDSTIPVLHTYEISSL